ncbi:MAG: biotin transporter BioY [Elusimicrobiota bacterium]|jgi:biotin transport system substrate-specific component|nr:biotin transporter BioY [Elusimicrobiota bacterium]
MSSKNLTLRTAFIALFAALISLSCFISIPVGTAGVPIVLQNMIVIVAGAVLGVDGAIAAALFLIAGAIGFPVFAGGRGGIASFLAPSGGYLIGYFFGALTAGLIVNVTLSKNSKPTLLTYIKVSVAVVLGFAIIDIFGTARLAQIIMKTKHLSFAQSIKPALLAGVAPFIIGDIIKIIIAIPLSVKLRSALSKYLS